MVDTDKLAESVVNLHPDLQEGKKREQVLTSVKSRFSQLEKEGRLTIKSIDQEEEKTR